MFIGGRQPTTIRMQPTGGWNAALHPSQIADNELSEVYNFIYDANTGKLVTRPGTKTVSSAKLDDPIQFLYGFIRSDGESYLMAVSGGNLYYYKFADDTWVLVSALNNTDTPTMATFNGKLFVADGSAGGLLTWDGTAVAREADSPQATIVFEARNRLACNSVTELDAIYLCATEDASTWIGSAVPGDSVALRAGYGDGMTVNGFAMISSTLIVSKLARTDGKATKKKLWKIELAGASTGWQADDLSANNAAINPHCLVGFGDNMYYLDSEGFESLVPTQAYGDITTDPVIGGKINSRLAQYAKSATEARMLKLPGLAAVWMILEREGVSNQIYTFSPLGNGFSELEFGNDFLTVAEYGGAIYLAGDSGYLHTLQNQAIDETAPGVEQDVVSLLRFKMLTGSGDLLLTKVISQLNYEWSGTYQIEVYGGNEEIKRLLQKVDFNVGAATDSLNQANYELYSATWDLGGSRVNRQQSRAHFRSDGIMLQIRTMNSGRISVSELDAEITVVGR